MVRVSHLTENCKSASIGVRSFVATVALDAVPQQIMDKILIRYEGNGSSRYDEKEYLKSASRIKKKNIRGPLKIGEYVTIKTKNSHLENSCCKYKPRCTSQEKKDSSREANSSYFVRCSVGIFSSSWWRWSYRIILPRPCQTTQHNYIKIT